MLVINFSKDFRIDSSLILQFPKIFIATQTLFMICVKTVFAGWFAALIGAAEL